MTPQSEHDIRALAHAIVAGTVLPATDERDRMLLAACLFSFLGYALAGEQAAFARAQNAVLDLCPQQKVQHDYPQGLN